MSSVALGGENWTYYETIGGGSGASPDADGASAVQCHMTNTLNTPAEALELQYPLRVRRFERASNSGGAGKFAGGDGIIREIQALAPCEGTVITDRRVSRPYGLASGKPAQPGANSINDTSIPGKSKVKLSCGDILRIITPGGGGFGNRVTIFDSDPRWVCFVTRSRCRVDAHSCTLMEHSRTFVHTSHGFDWVCLEGLSAED